MIITEKDFILDLEDITYGDFLSDHRLVHGKLKIAPKEYNKKTITYRDFKHASTEDLIADIHLDELSQEYEIDLDELLMKFHNNCKSSLDTHAPWKTTKVKAQEMQPWYNTDLLKRRKDLRYCFRKWYENKTDIRWQNYLKIRKKYWFELKTSKKLYFQQQIKDHKNDSKFLYKLVEKLTGSTQLNPMPESINDKSMADDFANFFYDKISNIRKDLDHHHKYSPLPSPKPDTQKLKDFYPVNSKDVLKELRQMEFKSCELDAISSKIIGCNLTEFLDTLVLICNKSLSEGYFSTTWNNAIVRPLIKNINKGTELKNYRPVSNLSFLSKLVERVGMKQILWHCDLNGLMPYHQSAYRKFHSSETLLIRLINDLLWAFENSELIPQILLDLSATFDTVPHDQLINVLIERFHIDPDGKVMQWIKSYLQPRTFKVCVDKSYSEEKSLSFSVPQGSCNGPLYFVLFCSTITDVISENIQMFAFADDHETHKPCKPIALNNTLEQLSNCIARIKTWMDENRLKMKPDKTEFIVFGSRKSLPKCNNTTSIEIIDQTISRSSTVRYLGAFLDQNLTLDMHFNCKCQIAKWNLIKIKRIRKFLTPETTKIIIHALVLLHLDYANGILYGTSQTNINKFQRIQNMASKTILCKNRRDSVTSCLIELHWLPIQARLDFKILLMVYKCLNQQARPYLSELLDLIRTADAKKNITTKNYLKYEQLEIPRVQKKTFASRSFSVIGPSLWNNIPENIRKCQNVDEFKTSLKTLLFNKYLTKSNNYRDIYIYY